MSMAHAGASPHWEKMWSGGLAKGQAFDVGGPSPTLVGALSRMKYAPRSGMRALVPGCGRAYDALALAEHGFDEVVAIDLSQTACDAARNEISASGHPASCKVAVQCADFFAYKGVFDFIWDATFLCALDPSVRTKWACQHHSLLAPDGRLVTCIFPIVEKDGGPPFAMSVGLVKALLEPQFKCIELLDKLPASEQHKPGGFTAPGPDVTAIATWAIIA